MNRNKILVLNNYSLKRVSEEVLIGVKPSHHLYGIIEMKDKGLVFDYLETDNTHFLYKIGTWMRKIPLLYFGDLYVQVRALKIIKNYDVIYAPCQDCTIFLGLLRYFKFINTPIVAIAHHPLLTGRLASIRRYSSYFFLNGHSFFPALSNIVASQIDSIARKNLSQELHWGPNVSYYKSMVSFQKSLPSVDIDIVAIGRTGRDYNTLIQAFNNTSVRVSIYCHQSFKAHMRKHVTENICIHFLKDHEELDYKDIVKIYANSKILAIPMLPQDSLCGLTSILDGIAMGMPIISTYNKYINIDIEKLGIGRWVEPFNHKQWLKITKELLSNPALRKSMCGRASLVGAEKNNINLFSSELIELLSTAV